MHCKDCPNMRRIHEDNCNFIKCAATSKRGKTIDWHADTGHVVNGFSLDGRTVIGGKFIPDPPEEIDEYFEKSFRNKSTPKWCPLVKDGTLQAEEPVKCTRCEHWGSSNSLDDVYGTPDHHVWQKNRVTYWCYKHNCPISKEDIEETARNCTYYKDKY